MTNEVNHHERLSELFAESKQRKVSCESDEEKLMKSKPSILSTKRKGKKSAHLWKL